MVRFALTNYVHQSNIYRDTPCASENVAVKNVDDDKVEDKVEGLKQLLSNGTQKGPNKNA